MHKSYRLCQWVGCGVEGARKGKTGRKKEKDRGSLGTELLKLPAVLQPKAVSKQHLFHVGMRAGQKEEHTMLLPIVPHLQGTSWGPRTISQSATVKD